MYEKVLHRIWKIGSYNELLGLQLSYKGHYV